ncbi:MAG: hypothetical protein AAF799_02195 [Myxococcota bacterium]
MSPDDAEPEPEASATEPEPEPESAPEPIAGWRRALSLVLIVGMAVVLPLWVRVVWDGQSALGDADVAHQAGDLDAEIEHLGRALRWRAPGSSHDEEALDRLWALAEQERERGAEGRHGALAAYREVRRGLLATRAWGIPHRDRWEQANLHIAALMAEQERELGLDTSEAGRAEQFHAEQLARPPGPDPTRGNLAALAFAIWVLCVALFVVRGLDAKGRLRPRAAFRTGLGALVSLVAWMVLLASSHG